MFLLDIVRLTQKVNEAKEECDRLCAIAYKGGNNIEVSQALLATSWSLRAAHFALLLASNRSSEHVPLGPSPSSRSATGGTG